MTYLDESFLDDEAHLRACDSRGTLRALATAGAQVREAAVLAQEAGVSRLARSDRPRAVIVAALGGSAMVADVLDLLAEAGSPVPVAACRNVPLPGWVGPLDLVVAVSLSGRAAGPLAVAAEAARRGAMLLTVGADDSPLAAVCARARGIHVGVGQGRVSSRTALWTLMVPVLLAIRELGLFSLTDADVAAVADALDEEADTCRPSSESFVNPAKSLALTLSDTVPVVLGDGALAGVAGRRAASMLSRTSRLPVMHGELPDAASQVVATFDGPFTAGGGDGVPGVRRDDDIFADPFLDGPERPRLGLLMVRDHAPELTTPQLADLSGLADAVVETATEAGARVATLQARPGHPLARLAGLVARTDFAATYLAVGLGIDPAVSRHVAALRDHARGL